MKKGFQIRCQKKDIGEREKKMEIGDGGETTDAERR